MKCKTCQGKGYILSPYNSRKVKREKTAVCYECKGTGQQKKKGPK